MKKNLTAFVIVGLLLAGVAAFVLPTSIEADTGTIQANVTVAEAIAVAGVDALVFGLLSAPSTGSDTWTVNATNGPLVQGGATSSVDLDLVDHSRGSFTIGAVGAASESVTYSVAVTTDFGDGSLSLGALQMDPPSPSLLDAITEDLTVLIGGTLTISAGAAPGLHSDAVITMTADYTP